jgi:hypothetical protein
VQIEVGNVAQALATVAAQAKLHEAARLRRHGRKVRLRVRSAASVSGTVGASKSARAWLGVGEFAG